MRIIGSEKLQEPTDQARITTMEIRICGFSRFLVVKMMLRQQCCV